MDEQEQQLERETVARYTFSLYPSVIEILERLARRHGRSRSNMLTQLIREAEARETAQEST